MCPKWVSLLTLPFLLLSACRKPEIQVYDVSKNADKIARPISLNPPKQAEQARPRGLALSWSGAAQWKELPPTQFRKGNYQFADDNGVAEITVSSFPGDTGGLIANANRWLRQASLPEVTEEELEKLVSTVSLPEGLTASVMDLKAENQIPSSMRIYAAVVPFEGESWFFKMSGPYATVQSQIPAFSRMIRSVQSAESAKANEPEREHDHVGDLKFDTPEGWLPSQGSSMRIASLSVEKEGHPPADFAITSFPGDTGGMVANVNRWRGQIGLPAWDAEQVQAAAQTFTNDAGLDFTSFELKADNDERADGDQRILVAVMEHAGRSWFFKLRGDALLLELQDEEFKALLDSVHFSHEGHNH